MPKVSCIIPAYNEGPRIAGVLSIISNHPLIQETVVIDDGSRDNTVEAVKKFSRVTLVEHGQNKGKNAAICTGINASTGDILVFIDSDLVGLNSQNLTDLITPVAENKADVSISLRINAPWQYRLIGLDYISGERAFHKSLLQGEIGNILKLPGFGLEVFINEIIIRNKCRVKVVLWNNVKSPWKYEKDGWVAGIRGDIRMTRQILKTVPLWRLPYQMIKLRELRVQ